MGVLRKLLFVGGNSNNMHFQKLHGAETPLRCVPLLFPALGKNLVFGKLRAMNCATWIRGHFDADTD